LLVIAENTTIVPPSAQLRAGSGTHYHRPESLRRAKLAAFATTITCRYGSGSRSLRSLVRSDRGHINMIEAEKKALSGDVDMIGRQAGYFVSN
jgi:hypothetical protein